MVFWYVHWLYISITDACPGYFRICVLPYSCDWSNIVYNLIADFNGWFILYLYLVISLTLSFSPSARDLKNAFIGILLLSCVCICIIFVNIPTITSVFLAVIDLLGTGLVIGLMFELIALFVSLPVIFMYWYNR